MRKMRLGEHALELHHGNITRQHTQAIVAGTDAGFHNHSAMGNTVHWHISNMPGGKEAMKALQYSVGSELGTVLTGKTGLAYSPQSRNSHIESVYHVSIFDPVRPTTGVQRRERPANATSIHIAVKNVLKQAMQDGVQHISIPALGTGGSGATMKQSVYATLAAVRDHFHQNPDSQLTVRLVYQSHRNLDEVLEHLKPIKRLGKMQGWDFELLEFDKKTQAWKVHE